MVERCKSIPQLGSSRFVIVMTYSQFDSNICVFYIFLGFLKNTWKYLIQRPIFKPFYFYNVFLKILENTSFWAPSKNTRISYVTTMRFVTIQGVNIVRTIHVTKKLGVHTKRP